MQPLVDIDDRTTWPRPLAAAVDGLAEAVAGSTSFTSDLRLPFEGEAEFWKLLDGFLVLAYHCTRLLEHEVATVRAEGLRPLSQELVVHRLRAAVEAGDITLEMSERLKAGDYTSRADWRIAQREGQVCFVLSRQTFDNHALACDALLSTWGGEAIYMGEAKRHETYLRTLGRPTIVKAALDLRAGPLKHYTAPDLRKVFVGAALGLDDRGADVHYRDAVPPEHLLGFLHPGNPDYDRHRDLPGR